MATNICFFSSGQSGSYGFIEGIFEGIRIEINGVSIKFGSSAFTATLQIQQILVFSAKRNWTVANDLRESRIKSEKEIVTWKKIQWASVRIEATWQDAGKLFRRTGDNFLVFLGRTIYLGKNWTGDKFLSDKIDGPQKIAPVIIYANPVIFS